VSAPPIIRCIDTETSGLEPPAQVVEVGFCDLVKAGDGWQVQEPQSRLYGVDDLPPQVRAIHHITAAEVAGLAPFDPLALHAECVDDGVSVIACHNLEFDQQFLGVTSTPALCTYKAALRIWPDAPSHSNACLRYWLGDQGLLALDDAKAMPPHRAGPDAYVTAHVLKALLQVTTANQMVRWAAEPRLLPRITFGKHKGPWDKAPTDYLNWVVTKSDLDADTKWNAERELERRRVPA
jgi:exodeoxyribonuclease X